MKIQTIKYTRDKVFGTGKIARSVKTESANIEHSKKQTYKGQKLVRTSNIVNEIQAGVIDRADHWKRKREERKNRRRAGF